MIYAIVKILTIVVAVSASTNTVFKTQSSAIPGTTSIVASSRISTATAFISSAPLTSMPASSAMMTSPMIHSSPASSAMMTSPMIHSSPASSAVMTSPMIHSSPASTALPTSSAKPTTTPKPEPPPYDVNVTLKDEKNGHICMWFQATMIIHYTYQQNKTSKSASLEVTGEDLEVLDASFCSSFNQTGQKSVLSLEKPECSLTFEFKNENARWILKSVGVTVETDPSNNEQLSGVFNQTDSSNNGLFSGQTGHGYKCDTANTLKLKTEDAKTTISVEFKKIFVQPFENGGVKNNEPNMCPAPEKPTKSSSVVPIAVGCALAGLIVIVLIAYLIGRRRSDAKGYQQV